jgi:hypothetical protein
VLTLDGAIRVFAEAPDAPPLTGLAFGPAEQLYVALLSELPLGPGRGAILTVTPNGELAVVVPELTMPIDVGFDAAGTMYVLEFSQGGTPTQPYIPASGRLLRIGPEGARRVVLERLNYPTALLFSSTGDLYIAHHGAFSAPRAGAILKIACRGLGEPAACPPPVSEQR